MMKHATATAAGMVAPQAGVDAGKKRPSMDLGDQDRVKRTKDAGDKVAAMAAAAAVPQFPGGAAMAMPLVPPGPWPYPSSFPLMPPMGPMGMPFCFPPAFFPAPFMFPPFWFANAMNACSAAAGLPGSAASTAPGVHAAAMAPAAGGMNLAPAMQMPPNAGMAPFAPLPMMAAAHAAAAANMQMQPMPPAPCAAPALAPVPVAAPLPTSLLQQLTSSSPDGGCTAGAGACGSSPTNGNNPGMPAPLFVDCCGPSLSDGGNSGAVTPSVSDGSIAAPATPEVNDISDQEFVSFIDSFLNLPDDGLACSIPLMVCGDDDVPPVDAGCHLMDDDTDLTCTLGLGLKLSKSDSLLNLLDRELACAANASAAAGFAI